VSLSDRTVWIYIHVPKCGGTTTKSILAQNFGEKFREEAALLYHKAPYTLAQAEAIIRAHHGISCFSSHRFSAHLPYEAPGIHCIAFSQVRDPVERLVSHYFFHRTHSENFFPEINNMSLVEYFDWSVVDGNAPEIANYQSWFLTGYHDERSREVIDALTRRRWLMVFPLSRFDEMLIYLQARFPNEFRDCRYSVKNWGRTRQKMAHSTLPETRVQAMKEYAAHDYRLLDVAHRQLNQLLCEYVGSTEEIKRRLNQLRKSNRSLLPVMGKIRVKLRRRLIRLAHRL